MHSLKEYEVTNDKHDFKILDNQIFDTKEEKDPPHFEGYLMANTER
jgi:hypothetical protein